MPDLPASAAEPESFTLRIDHDNLVVADLNKRDVATIPPETIGKEVSVGGYAFEVTYGRNATGDLAVMLTASSSNPGGLSFSMNGRHVEMGRLAISVPVSVTITVSNVPGQGQTTRIEASDIGAPIRVDGKPVAVAAPSASPVLAGALSGATVPESELSPSAALGSGSGLGATFDASTSSLPTMGNSTINLNPTAVTINTSPNPTTPF